jgi:hypothetical protein
VYRLRPEVFTAGTDSSTVGIVTAGAMKVRFITNPTAPTPSKARRKSSEK